MRRFKDRQSSLSACNDASPEGSQLLNYDNGREVLDDGHVVPDVKVK